MTVDHSPPPLRELPRERHKELKRHLIAEIARPVPDRKRALRVLIAVAALALAGAIGFVATRSATDTASAAEVRAKLAEGLSIRRSISGEFSVRSRPARERPGSSAAAFPCCAPVVPRPTTFVVGSDGSYSNRSVPFDPSERDIAYDASTGIETSCCWGRDSRGRLIYLRSSHLDPAAFSTARMPSWECGCREHSRIATHAYGTRRSTAGRRGS